ncbi:MAG: metallophosphoesterase family protein [Deltaproteobacteria bacterium]|nr:metallophosphoesterase family protein [Deltaproteobacteria bacterium]
MRRAPRLRVIVSLSVVLLVPLFLATWLIPPHNGRITYTRFELFVVLLLIATLTTFFVAGVREGARLLVGALRPARRLDAAGRGRAWANVAAAGCIGLAGIYARFVEPRWIEVVHHEIAVDGVKNRVRLAVFSDLHSDARFDLDRDVVDPINAADPDLVLFLGDALNDASRAEAFRAALGEMQAKVAKLAIRGNWDVWYWSGIDLFRGTGFRELVADTVRLEVNGTPMTIVGHGWEDAWVPNAVVPRAMPDGVTLMLYHGHDYAEVAAKRGVELYLCGDTHGGQVALPFLGPLFAIGRFGLRYARGHYRVGPMEMYVTRGIGVEAGFPFRFAARPEISIIDLVPPAKP